MSKIKIPTISSPQPSETNFSFSASTVVVRLMPLGSGPFHVLPPFFLINMPLHLKCQQEVTLLMIICNLFNHSETNKSNDANKLIQNKIKIEATCRTTNAHTTIEQIPGTLMISLP
jgi:hypothetical protein